jgi:hypothetical protein
MYINRHICELLFAHRIKFCKRGNRGKQSIQAILIRIMHKLIKLMYTDIDAWESAGACG